MGVEEDYGPRGDASCHLSMEQIEKAWAGLPAPPRDSGRLALIVARPADGVRDELASARVTPGSGVPGDRWQRATPDVPRMQLAVMRRDIAELLANGQPISHAGDNLFVDFDLSSESLPTGSKLRVGDAVFEVTPEPHDGCHKFQARFGAAALRFISARDKRDDHLRGVYWMVIQAGTIRVGDTIERL